MAEHNDERNAKFGGTVFDRPHGRRIGHVAGIARHKQFAEPSPAKHQFGRHAAVGTTDDRRPGRLCLGDRAALLRQIGGAKLRRADEFLVARL